MKQSILFKEPRIKFLNNCLLIDREILVFGDFHLGKQEYLGGIPAIQLKEILGNLREIFGYLKKLKIKIKKLVILGDFKHMFGEISDLEWRQSIQLLDYFIEKVGRKNIILIKGNHDKILEPILKKRKLKMSNFYVYKDVVFMHGDKKYLPENKKIKILVLGHLHPTITLTDNYKREKYKCFLVGRWKRKLVYILPSFGDSGPGYNLNNLGFFKYKNNLFIKEKKLKAFEIVIYNNKNKKDYNFWKVKDLI